MTCVYGFGFNGFGQTLTNNHRCLRKPFKICGVHNCDKTLFSFAWDSVCYLTDNDILLHGFCDKKCSSLHKVSLHQTRFLNEDVSNIVYSGGAVALLTKVGEFYLYEVVHHMNEVSTDNHVQLYCTNVHLSKVFEMKEETLKCVVNGFDPNQYCFVTEKGNIQRIKRSDVSVPFHILPEIPLKQVINEVSCGVDHCLALTVTGNVYSWGIGSRGQLGHGHLGTVTKPAIVEMLDGVKIKSVSCGGWHSVALADTNDLYTWGWNESGQTGFPAPQNTFMPPVDTKLSSSIVQNQSSENGSSLQGKISSDAFKKSEATAIVLSPQLLELEGCVPVAKEDFVSIAQVSCGSRHTAAVTSDGRLVTWGWCKYGQLGHGACSGSENDSGGTSEGTIRDHATLLKPHCDFVHKPAVVCWFENNNLSVSKVHCSRWSTYAFVRPTN